MHTSVRRLSYGVEAQPREERAAPLQLSHMEAHVVGPLLAPPQLPGLTPSLVVLQRPLVVVLPPLHARHTAPGAHWGDTHRHTS